MRKTTVLASLACVALMATSAVAAVPWTTPSGSGDIFTYSGGESDNGLFGDPVVVGNQFIFTPNFLASTTGDANPNDQLDVNIFAKPGHTITGIIIEEIGSYNIDGTGEVTMSGSLLLQDLDFIFPPVVINDPLIMAPSENVNGTNMAGPWTGGSIQDLESEALGSWQNMHLVLNNELAATASAGTASIAKTGVIITVLPEPATATLALLGLGFIARRRRTA